MSRNLSPQPVVTFSGGGAGTGTNNSNQMSLTTSASAAAIPKDASGSTAKFVWLQTTAVCYVRFQVGAGNNATVNDVQLSPNNPILAVVGPYTYISAIADSGTAKLNVSAIEIG